MNPFSYSTIVKGAQYFDRIEESQRIIDTLTGGNNLVLFAPRRYGKSSLVLNAADRIEKMGFNVIYFDFMAVYSRESFIENYTKAILNKQSNWQKFQTTFSRFVQGVRLSMAMDAAGNPEFSLHFDELKITDRTLESVIDLPEKLAESGKRLIVILDEFQDIHKLNGDNFENLMRSKIQHHHHVNYLFLGSKTHLLSDMFANKNRPFYQSASMMTIHKLPVKETIAFLQSRFAEADMRIDETSARHLIENAQGIPYYIQFLASEIWQQSVNSEKIVLDAVIDFCTDKIIDLKNDYYFELFDRRSKIQKKLLIALTHDNQGIFSQEFAHKWRLSAVSSTQKAVSELINDGIIEKSNNEYDYSDPFFRKWILRL